MSGETVCFKIGKNTGPSDNTMQSEISAYVGRIYIDHRLAIDTNKATFHWAQGPGH